MNRSIKCLYLLAILCTCQKAAQAQKTEILNLQPKHISISSSPFSNVEVIDTRLDTSNLGFIQKGALNRLVPVITTLSLKDESKMLLLADRVNCCMNGLLLYLK